MKGSPRISCLHLYVEGFISHLSIQEIIRYLQIWMKGSDVDFRGHLFRYHLSTLSKGEIPERIQRLAEKLALLRIRDTARRDLGNQGPMDGEVAYERCRIEQEDFKSFGIIYDGFGLQGIYSSLIAEDERYLNHCHIIFTNQLLGTWDEDDHRYHARVSVYGFPSLISTTGVVEAPAKPREFYLKRRLGVPLEVLKREFRGRFIDHGDPRLTEVIKGYIMQVLFFHMSGNPFCNDPHCRLYNAHWQEELIHAQLGGKYEFCTDHRRFLNRLVRFQ
ncbi:MAG: hypothetical protein JSW70_09510 [Syntrophobacterales bacterium]|nr:MAG: hypothetical protein JSW70_09510 [Syntrophobacterales bacterium]